MSERYSKVFMAAKQLANMCEDKFLPGIIGDEGEMNVCIKSPVFEYEDFMGGREIFLELLENCDRIDFIADNNEMINMVAVIKEGQ